MDVKAAAALALLASCDAGRPPGPETFELRWRLAPEQKLLVRARALIEHESRSEGTVPPELKPMPAKYETNSLTEILVLDEGPSGEFGLRLVPLEYSLKGQISEISLELEFRNGAWTIERVGDGEAEARVAVKKQLDEMKEKSSRTITRRFGYLATRDPSAKSGVPPLPLSWPALPAIPVNVGGGWSEPLALAGPAINLRGEPMTAKNKLVSFDKGVAVIESNLLDESRGARNESNVRHEASQSVRRRRWARFDARRGLYVEMKDEAGLINSGQIVLTGGAEGKYRAAIRMTVLLELVEK